MTEIHCRITGKKLRFGFLQTPAGFFKKSAGVQKKLAGVFNLCFLQILQKNEKLPSLPHYFI